jgi:dolichol-phosphate mannosyltransferase
MIRLDRPAPLELSLVIPVYNEGPNIAPVLRRLVASLNGIHHEILVVYDFDEDDTVPVVQALQQVLPSLVLYRNYLGRGVLNALKAGLAASVGCYVLVTMADGSDDPETIPLLLEQARGGADLVAASRYMRGGHQVGGPLLKRLMSRAAGLSLHWVAGVKTHDPTNNFKLYKRELLDSVVIESSAGFELALELTVKAHAMGMRVAEVPTWRDRTTGESRFQIRRWLPHYLRWYSHGMRTRIVSRPAVREPLGEP